MNTNLFVNTTYLSFNGVGSGTTLDYSVGSWMINAEQEARHTATKAYHVSSVRVKYVDYRWEYNFEFDQIATVSSTPVMQKTTYISKVTALTATYPVNGVHTDGYWYVLSTE